MPQQLVSSSSASTSPCSRSPRPSFVLTPPARDIPCLPRPLVSPRSTYSKSKSVRSGLVPSCVPRPSSSSPTIIPICKLLNLVSSSTDCLPYAPFLSLTPSYDETHDPPPSTLSPSSLIADSSMHVLSSNLVRIVSPPQATPDSASEEELEQPAPATKAPSASGSAAKARARQTRSSRAAPIRSNTTKANIQVMGAYKPVDRKIRPVPGIFPQEAAVERRIPEDPLLSLPTLPTHPPDFEPTERLTRERLELVKLNEDGFLLPEEVKLFEYILRLCDKSLAFSDEERGTLRQDYFSDYIIPTVPHIPWTHKNIPIPPGIEPQVIDMLREKIRAGVYEPAQSSYRSRWFCVVKKNGKLRIVHDLQTLNGVTIKDAGVPPHLDHFVEKYANRACNTVFDLFWGFDARRIHPKSRDTTAFQTPLGALRLTAMPMGFTNSPAEFQNCMVFILGPEIPDVANIFIDDLAIRGPETTYPDAEGNPELLEANPGIRRFIWEHAHDVLRVMHRIMCAGATFNPLKAQIARKAVVILGQTCTPEGRLVERQKAEKISEWPTPRNPTDVRGFLGLCGTVRIWIADYSRIARPLTALTRKDIDFVWSDACQEAFDKLKEKVTAAPALRSIDYTSHRPIILSVDSSHIAVGFILSQLDEEGRRRPARYGSLPMGDTESRYSQAKLELYGLYRAIKAFSIYLVGAHPLFVEVDAAYIKGMLAAPDLQPSASINRWIQGILNFDFTLVHVPGKEFSGPDGLSRRTPNPWDFVSEDVEDTENFVLYAMPGDPMRTFKPSREQPVPYVRAATSEVTSAVSAVHVYAARVDSQLSDILSYLRDNRKPAWISSDKEQRQFEAKAIRFFIRDDALFRRRLGRIPQKVIFEQDTRRKILEGAHERAGHRGIEAVTQTVKLRFYWPDLETDVANHVKSCHECQIRQTAQWKIPPTVSAPTRIWEKVYIDVMFMPKAQGYRYIVAARDDLTRVTEGRALRTLSAKNLANFFWDQIYTRYGVISQVVTDNGSEVQKAFAWMMERLGVPHVHISPYNPRANGVVERGHFILREAIVKACQGKIERWPEHVAAALYADRITVSRQTGYSPYFLLHGRHPTLPMDLTEATFLGRPFSSHMTTEDLLAYRIRQVQRLPADLEKAAACLKGHRLRSKAQFEKQFRLRLMTKVMNPGALVLVANSSTFRSLNKKAKPRYIGPYRVVRRNPQGAYILCELDGTTIMSKFAAIRVVPYIARDPDAIRALTADETPQDPTLEKDVLEQALTDDSESETEDETSDESE
ncbi:unnamed protein product [Peniophora sp. CBMAI 1063]|nr:unnamed protein product [Peniophora sp. CBMAI 1063]